LRIVSFHFFGARRALEKLFGDDSASPARIQAPRICVDPGACFRN